MKKSGFDVLKYSSNAMPLIVWPELSLITNFTKMSKFEASKVLESKSEYAIEGSMPQNDRSSDIQNIHIQIMARCNQ